METAAAVDGTEGCSAEASKWHDIDWRKVLAGAGTANRYYARSGLIRKDRLSLFAPRAHHPETVVLDSFQGLCAGLEQLGAANQGGAGDSVKFVLKKAHSSNASGMRFLTGGDAEALVRAGSGKSSGYLLGPAAAVGTSAAVVAALHLWRSRTTAAPEGGRWTTMLLAGCGLACVVCAAAGRKSRGGTLASRALVADIEGSLSATASQEKPTVWVLQNYVQPMLYHGRKFHLRVLVLCVGDLQAYAHENVRVLLATEDFGLGREDALRRFAHVTNMGASGAHPEYNEASQNLSLSCVGQGEACRIFADVIQVLGDTLVAICADTRRHFFTLPNCWELFGADFLVEDISGRVMLLEINASPSMAMYGTGSGVRTRLLGSDPLKAVPPEWKEIPLGR
eukprot:gnl/TRDRNA2_/TRDRNA2_83724_c0_seq1.p1 gnl/TRDRNA2_/TRDRNA2_83724_c0~~gnl/TRDRNA2_/TRDRNA2_83724_c0_seq1.p1  ORF type:complete len:408 (+),score=72.84 gnl/TRDRNA2_/TRDRNA2_83724_c0_seq1:40-1224(+)